MKERPILFSGPMVRAILEGRKTQTRRIVKPQPVSKADAEPGDVIWFGAELNKVVESRGRNKAAAGMLNAVEWHPYGGPGDRLWVKETTIEACDQWGGEHVVYKADGASWLVGADADGNERLLTETTHQRGTGDHDFSLEEGKTWPSIHMHRWKCRLILEVVSVRVERLQDINEADAIAEGRCLTKGDPRGYFPETWEAINGPGSWAANPWVWVVEFKRLEVKP